MTTSARPFSALLLVGSLVLAALPSAPGRAAPADEAQRTGGPPVRAPRSPLGPGPLALAPRPPLAADRAASMQQEPPTPWEAIDSCVREEMDIEAGPGAAIAVYQGGKLVYQKGYGTRVRDGDQPVDAQTQFRIGSITKMFTAAAVMQEVDAGRVDLRAPLTTYIPELALADPGAAASLTPWNLLTHSSGYPDNVLLGLDSIDGAKDDAALAAWVGTQSGTHLHVPPGTLWNYSNSNFTLAGLVAERASGIPYHRLMAERVFARAGLTNTTLLPADVLARGNFSTGYWTNPLTGEPQVSGPDAYDNWAAAPAGYAFSTAGDLARWAALLMHGGDGVISPAAAQAMQARQQSLDYFPDYDYGFGVFRERYKGLDVMSHGGNIPGWGGYLLWVPEADFAVATLVSAFPATLDRSAYCAVDAVLKPQGEQPGRPAGDPTEWPGFLGDFGGWVVDDSYLRTRVEAKADGGLAMVFPEIPIDMQGTPFRTDLRNAFVRTFAFDSNGDGQPDDSITFIPDKADPSRLWIRNRGWVLSHPELVTPTARPEPSATPTAKPLRSAVYLPRLASSRGDS